MHSSPCHFSNSAINPLLPNLASRDGIRFSGHASTHRPQLIHAKGSNSATASLPRQRREEEVFVVGTSSPNMANPIIGPPEIIFSGCSLNPPAASKSSWKLVPIKNSKLPGSSTASPVTVKILLVTGFPSFTAWYTATSSLLTS